jgi:hypothetical protein
MKLQLLFASLAAALCLPIASMGAPLYLDRFNADSSANWTVNDSGLSDITAVFGYDYSQIGVPSPTGNGKTLGLKLTANNTGGVFSGFSVSPNGQSFSGNYKLMFDLWQNYVGPLGPGGNGTTQLSTFGIGTAGNVSFWPGAAVKESVAFAATLDGGSASDYRAYSSAAPTSYPAGNAVYQAPGGQINDSNAYYTAAYPAQSAPAAQVSLFPGQTGSTNAGEISFKWRKVVIDVSNGFATWSVDGLPIAKVDLSTVTLGGGNILLGHADTNAGSSTDPNDVLLNVTLIDNVRVVVPEPSSAVLCLFGLMGLLVGRRRS